MSVATNTKQIAITPCRSTAAAEARILEDYRKSFFEELLENCKWGTREIVSHAGEIDVELDDTCPVRGTVRVVRERYSVQFRLELVRVEKGRGFYEVDLTDEVANA